MMLEEEKCRHLDSIPDVFCSFCNLNTPQTLLNLCFEYVSNNVGVIAVKSPYTGKLELRKGIALPVELCERLLSLRSSINCSINSEFINVFRDRECTRLKRVKLKGENLTDADLEVLLAHRLVELDITNCPLLTTRCIDYLSEYGSSLLSLSLGSNTKLFPERVFGPKSKIENEGYTSYIFHTPALRRLIFRNMKHLQDYFFVLLLAPLNSLTHLDLSSCSNIGTFNYSIHLTNLTSLVLYNIENMEEKITAVCALTNLRHLDISQCNEELGKYSKPNEILAAIVKCLPYLTSLDISGTNLAGRGVAKVGVENFPSDIPGLVHRANNPFEFLGLYETSHDACLRHDIPAKLIAGNANEEQILISALAYLERPEMLQKVLNDLFHLFRYESCEFVGQALNIVLEAMNRHVFERHIQISGSATLFYIVKGTMAEELSKTVRAKKKIITTLLNGMAAHINDETMMRNGCLTLCQFKIPNDVLFEYNRLVDILLHSVNGLQQESFVQRIGIYLLNSLACQVDGRQKIKLGELGVISKMISLISDRLERGLCDDVLEVAWSTMWNVTDETPCNCQKFLEKNGMEYFLLCLQKFPHKEELLRNMMGLLGNVAEVQSLRHYLVTSEYLSVFSTLLESRSDGIEVSYNAAGVISHIASDGPEVWTVAQPSRDQVLAKMVTAIGRWDIHSARNINYRSFEPILALVRVYHTPECQNWAIWALANLTQVYPGKYCELLEKEGGLELLTEIIDHPAPPRSVKELAEIAINNCRKYKQLMVRMAERLDGYWITKEFPWSKQIEKILKETFKFDSFRTKQLAAINATLNKKDVLLLMPTGGGKSLVYQLPAVVTKDQLIALKRFGIKADTINSSSSKEHKKKIHNYMTKQDNELKLLYVTPEWLEKSKQFMSYLQKCYQNGLLKNMFPDVPFMGLTATATMNILIDVQKMLDIKDCAVITAPFNRPNLYYKVIQKPSDKNEALTILENLLQTNYKNQSGIIYTTTIKETEELTEHLRKKGLQVMNYHAQLEPDRKRRIHEKWLENKYQAVIATIAFGMGIDKPDVRFVIHYSMPKSMEGLYQESGRAGRDGKKSDCLLMFALSDYLRILGMASSKVEEANALSVLNYCMDNGKCRRSLIAQHFEEVWDKENYLDRAYVPSQVEKKKLNSQYFKTVSKGGKVFNLILPPPNITGTLHLGHALTGTIQDILVRWKTMQGFETKWVPGLDHAGIATQVVVEKQLWKEEQKTRHDIGRKEFCKRVWDWKENKQATIVNQMKRLGLSLDWDRQVFTMDPAQAAIVSEVFVNLFDKGLIYRKDSLVNWSCFLRSAISDIEVDHVEIDGNTTISVPGHKEPVKFGRMIYFAYKLCDSDEEIIVATTRPETILGDVAVAVHPSDDRYSKLIGRKVHHPFRKEAIPIIADDFVDKQFGTGAVKITPAHDHADFLVAKRHSLQFLQVFDEMGRITSVFDDYRGQPRFEVRNRIIERLESMSLLRAIKEHKMSVPICSRSGDVVEFLSRPQWFVSCTEMAQRALKDVEEGRLVIEPAQFRDNWFDWLQNIRDWCISRQLWWGHRIPVYLCQFGDEKQWVAAANKESACQKASRIYGVPQGSISAEQDNDVLDTWFSSALLPFSVFGWPNVASPEFSKFYPLSLMETGHDILFFWVARMVMLGTEVTGQLPFKKVLLHGIICDSRGRKMSKSLGNVISPDDVIDGTTLEGLNQTARASEKAGILTKSEMETSLREQRKMFPDGIPECGADALRFTLVSHNIKSHFINFDVQECHTNKLFCNKIWQATKFTKMWFEQVAEAQGTEQMNENSLTTMDRWILSRFSGLVQTLQDALEKYEFHVATLALKNFLYYDFCDNYLESTKRNLRDVKSRAAAGHCWTLVYVLDGGLRALHPFMPHITVHLHQTLPLLDEKSRNFPVDTHWRNLPLEDDVDDVLETIKGIRRLKKIFNITKKHNSEVKIITSNREYPNFKQLIEDLTGFETISIRTDHPDLKVDEIVVKDTLSNKATLYVTIPVELRDNLLTSGEKLRKQKEKLECELQKMTGMISDSNYKMKNSEETQKSHEKRVLVLEEKITRIDHILSIL
ncbi:uncharacterized protein LOC123307655 [Coccinella septempunctata]|uniref:uncharacterized protein LOC123307655 n=1 Tax=Coccinella septempunctata TaxID=41139 RepID=UPI001D098E53|nr:uncharacterized protein LOC123307655 [Coccinella septempunctata]